MRHSLLAIVASIILCLGACAPGHNNYSSFETIPSYGWPYSDTLSFLPRLDDSVASGTLALTVRHSANYPYANLWVEVSTPGDSVLGVPARTDTVNMRLCDRNGRWLGRGLGVSFQMSDTLDGAYVLADSVPLHVRHVMRVDTLPDIEQVGVIFIPSMSGKSSELL